MEGQEGSEAEAAELFVSTSATSVHPVDTDVTPEQAELVRRLAASLEPFIASHADPEGIRAVVEISCDEYCLKRFLRGNLWNYEVAESQLRESVQWRYTAKPANPCQLCAGNPFAHSLRIIGFDKGNRPIMYLSYGQARERFNPEANVQHCAATLEEAIRYMECMNKGGNPSRVEQWVMLIDFDGFSIKDCSPKTLQLTAKLFALNYQERLGLAVMIDAPWLFSGAWKVIKPLQKQTTIDKVIFSSIDALRKNLERPFDDETISWLLTELAENRSPAGQNKRYWEWRNQDGSPKKHDSRGTARLTSSPFYVNPVKSDHHQSAAFEASSS